ncbi:AMP-binding protein [Thermocatellispora tengchongensis]|uniref:AMP-binding protein n=1 Tax=Thermocatellispora tengchongensis TaxID=1073253 RepID=UPI0036274D02
MSGTQFNAGVWLTHRHVREGRGDRLAVRAGTTLTYAGLSELVGLVTAGLRGLGLRRDDRVLFVTNDDVPMFSGILSAFCGGFVAVPVSTMLGAKELGTIIADCGACVVVASPEYGPQVQEALTMAPEVRHLVCDGCMPLPAPAGITSLTWQDPRRGGRAGAVRAAPARRHVRGLLGAVALHLWHNRCPQGRDAPSRQHPARVRDLRRPGARHPA